MPYPRTLLVGLPFANSRTCFRRGLDSSTCWLYTLSVMKPKRIVRNWADRSAFMDSNLRVWNGLSSILALVTVRYP
jgi:hypothetical protein